MVKKMSLLMITACVTVFLFNEAYCGQKIGIVTAIEKAKKTIEPYQIPDNCYVHAELKSTPCNECIPKDCVSKVIPEDYVSPLCLEVAEKLKGHTYWVVSFRRVQNTPPIVGCTFCVFIDAETGEHLASICS